MSEIQKTLDRVLRGDSDASIHFNDLRALLKHLGFVERIRGSHHIFTRSGLAEILNLQPRGNRAKPYQVKQVRKILLTPRLVADEEAGIVEPSRGEEPPSPPGTPPGRLPTGRPHPDREDQEHESDSL